VDIVMYMFNSNMNTRSVLAYMLNADR
jgi:hypothetical protein